LFTLPELYNDHEFNAMVKAIDPLINQPVAKTKETGR